MFTHVLKLLLFAFCTYKMGRGQFLFPNALGKLGQAEATQWLLFYFMSNNFPCPEFFSCCPILSFVFVFVFFSLNYHETLFLFDRS